MNGLPSINGVNPNPTEHSGFVANFRGRTGNNQAQSTPLPSIDNRTLSPSTPSPKQESIFNKKPPFSGGKRTKKLRKNHKTPRKAKSHKRTRKATTHKNRRHSAKK